MNKRKILIVSILLLSAILIYTLIILNKIQYFDNTVYEMISSFISQPFTTFAKAITTIGSEYIIIPICITLTIVFWKKVYGKFVLINLCTTFIINQGLKFLIKRPRPSDYNLIIEKGFSFPSGHSMIAMAFYGYIIYLIYKEVKNKYIKWSLISILTTIIILIGLSRIYLGVHYASDVLAGFIISLAYLIIFISLQNTVVISEN